MHLLSEDELMLYVDGLQQIRKNGKYQIMVDAHSIETEIHRGTSFFFYHTYFVWEVETQIRALGSKWNCFAVPYYDWTIDAGRERNPLILNTVFGGDGEPGNNNCVTDPHNKNLWGIIKWPVRELCNPAEDVEVGCCLKRNLDSTQKLSVAQLRGHRQLLLPEAEPRFDAETVCGLAAGAHARGALFPRVFGRHSDRTPDRALAVWLRR